MPPKMNKPGRGHPASSWDSATLNNATYIEYYNRLKNLSISVYEWKNAPHEIDTRFLELTLFEIGMAVFFHDDVLKQFVALTTKIGGRLNIYRIPVMRSAYASNGYHRNLSDRDSVLIFNDYLHQPTHMQVSLYARRLYEIERTIDVNIKSQKFPVLVKSSEQQRLTMQNLYMQYDGNEPFIFADKSLDPSLFSVLRTDSPYVADKLNDLKHQIWNEAMSYLGIENANTDKRERLITDEVQSNMGTVDAQRIVRLNARRDACSAINRMFGLNMTVDFREDNGKAAETGIGGIENE